MVGCMSGDFLRGKKGIFFILFFLFCLVGFGQESQVDDDTKLKDEILAVYKLLGEEGLRNFVKGKKDIITSKFIVNLAKSGIKERKEEWLIVCKIVAEEKEDEISIVDVLFRTGEYYRVISDYNKAMGFFDKALSIYTKIKTPLGQGDVYLSKGLIYFYTGKISRASEMFEKALPLFIKAKNPQGQGNIYLKKGEIYFQTGYNSKAFEMYEKALPLFENAKYLQGQGNVYNNKGNIYRTIGNNSKAFEMYDKALPFFEEGGILIGLGNVYKNKGSIFSRTGDNSKALEMYEKALSFYKKAKEPIGQGNIYVRKGNIYFHIGNHLKALEMYEKALPFFKKANAPRGQANAITSIGEIYFYMGNNSKALEMYDKALPFYEKVGDPIGQGDIFANKGKIFLYKGYISEALKMYDKALLFFEKARSPVGQGNVYKNRGVLYLMIGDNSRALEMYDKALLFYEKADSPIGQGNIYLRKGHVYFYTGDNSKALEMYDKALPFYEKARSSAGQGNIYWSKGSAYLHSRDFSKALGMYDKALPLFEKMRSPINQGNVYLGKGEIYFFTGKNSKSIEMYDEALRLFKKADFIALVSNALHGKAKVLVKLGKRDEALQLFQKGIDKLEKVRSHTSSYEMKKLFMDKVYKQYEETVMFLLENKYHDKSFKYAEAMRNRLFLDRMAEGLIKLDKGLASDLKEKRDNLVAKLSMLSKEINTAAGKEDEKKLRELKEEYRSAEREFEELLVKIRLNNPLYASVRYPEPITVKELQENVLETDELLLRYFISQDNFYVFLISKKDFSVITLDIKEKDINEIVSEYLFSVEEKNSRRVRKHGRQLYRQLFQPLESSLKDRKELIIIPDGPLAKVPFESLVIDDKISRKPVYLLEKYRVKYIQSASILAILRKHYQRDSANKHFIGFGDPVYDYQNFEKGKTEIGTPSTLNMDSISGIHRNRYEQEGGIFTRLKSSGEEVNAIAQLFKTHSQKYMSNLRENANEAKAKSPEIKEFDYIHFACHAILGDGFQSLVLSQLPQSTEDGYFTLNEIMNCDYHAKLVVLSACQTGRGKMEKGEGVTGLTQAVMHAGTPAVVASLWNVEDIATKELMVKFYKYLLEENLSKEDALRKAKLDLIKSGRYSSPFYWSAFVMYGE